MNLSVLPNRFISLDDDGDPCGYVLRVDLRQQSSKPILLGAQRVLRNGKLKVEFDDEPTELPDLPASRRMLKSGELLAANEPTARRAGLSWKPLDEQIARARAVAAARYQAHHGTAPSWADPTLTPTTAEAP